MNRVNISQESFRKIVIAVLELIKIVFPEYFNEGSMNKSETESIFILLNKGLTNKVVEYFMIMFEKEKNFDSINILLRFYKHQFSMKFQIRKINKILFSVDELTLEKIYNIIKCIFLENKKSNLKDLHEEEKIDNNYKNETSVPVLNKEYNYVCKRKVENKNELSLYIDDKEHKLQRKSDTYNNLQFHGKISI